MKFYFEPQKMLRTSITSVSEQKILLLA